MNTVPAIQCQNVYKSYSRQQVLENIDLEVPKGNFYGLVGVNGSGKSTMIKAMLDLVSIDDGLISLFGKSHRSVSSREQVAYLPDRFSPPVHLKCKHRVAQQRCGEIAQCRTVGLQRLETGKQDIEQPFAGRFIRHRRIKIVEHMAVDPPGEIVQHCDPAIISVAELGQPDTGLAGDRLKRNLSPDF